MAGWVLADTSGLVAYFVHDDQWNPPAVRSFDEVIGSGRRFLLTSDIFDEVVTSIRRTAGYRRGVAAGGDLRRSKLVRIVGIDDPLRERAWTLFVRHPFPRLSFTDCTSFAVMEKFGITEAFTFDEDFRKAGYGMLPAQP